jgi:medium-chain acyl-[acyl-carrier-protein] hydrolase
MTTPPSADRWVVRPRPRPRARLRLFCFPYAGGGASIYRSWPDELPEQIEVCAVQLPGREARMHEQPFDRLPPLIEALAQALEPRLSPPFAFFGHSMGALISFELARRLRALGRPGPAHLFVSGRIAPQVPRRRPPVHALPEPEFVEQVQRLNGTPDAVLHHKELRELVVPRLRADFAINETYSYSAEPPLACPISAFGGLEDDRAPEEELAAWQLQTRGAWALRMFPGDHFFIRGAQAALLQALSLDLRRLTGN